MKTGKYFGPYYSKNLKQSLWSHEITHWSKVRAF